MDLALRMTAGRSIHWPVPLAVIAFMSMHRIINIFATFNHLFNQIMKKIRSARAIAITWFSLTTHRSVTIRGMICILFLGASASVFGQNPSQIIQTENAKPGTTDWILTKVSRHADEPYDKGWHRRTEIEGYVSQTSVKAGEILKIYVSTDPAASYQIDIFRMGYYGGKGGRLVKTISPLNGGPTKGITQPTPSEGEKHRMECTWSDEINLEIPQDWVSGVYLGKLSTWRNTDAEAYIVFIVRDDRKADVIFQCSDMTWQAYNRWPQWHSLYDTPTTPWGAGQPDSYDVSFDRPYAIYWNGFPASFEPLTNGSGEFLMTEFPLAYWLEKEGYDVTYISNIDAHTDGAGLLRGKVFLSVGHDEYWTQEMFDNITNARDAGVNLAFLSGNAVSGRVELLPDKAGNPNRVMRLTDRGFEEAELMGSQSYGVGLADWTCTAPDHWAFEGTGMKKGDAIPHLVGWEFHGPPLGEHKDMVVLAQGNVKSYDGEERNRQYAATIYTADKGNYVFNAATCWWTKVLSTPPAYIDPPFIPGFRKGDERVRQITKNILDRMISVEIESNE